MSDFESVIENIKKRIEEEAPKAAAAAAQKIATELTQYSTTVMVQFYLSYSPTQYKRSGALGTQTIKRYYRNPHGKIFHGGVELIPNYSGSYPSIFYKYNNKVMSPEAIFDLAYEQGKHGNMEALAGVIHSHNFTIPPIVKPSPKKQIEQKRDDIVRRIDSYIHLTI